jgi:hypothetical protein
VTGRVRDDVGILAIGVAEVVFQRIEQHAGHEASRRDRSAGVTGGRHVVVKKSTERAIEEVERLEAPGLVG